MNIKLKIPVLTLNKNGFNIVPAFNVTFDKLYGP